MAIRTYLDACVLIALSRGEESLSDAVFQIIDNPDRQLVSSDFLRLETLPRPIQNGFVAQVEFLYTFFDAVHVHVPASPEVTKQAIELAARYHLSPMDALHLSSAILGEADEFISFERPTKPMFKVRANMKIISLYESTT